MESGSVRRRLRGTTTPSSDLWTWPTLVIFLLLAQLSQECPSVCECKWKSGKESVLCSNRRLRAIPNGLDPGTQVLDMSNNTMEKLPTRIFLSLNLLNLQKIFLSECGLLSLEGDSFAKLSNLIELDLSGNRLEFIPSHTFNSIPELRELKVSSNPISRLSNDAFVALPRLVRLELTACRLGTIETWAFRGLPDLKWLRLDNNRLLTVQAESFYPLRSLDGLEVAGNPWNCSCALQPLREWMSKNNVPFGVPPTCSSPKKVEGKSWDRLQLEDFACLPKITSWTDQERISRVVEGENGTLLCRLRTTPDTQVRWLSGNKGNLVTNGSVGGGASSFVLTESFVWASEEDGVRSGDRSLGIKISKLTVIRTTPREAGLYTCRAETKAGTVLANFTLLVLQTRAEGLTGRLLFTGAVVVALLTLVICLLLLCVILGSRRVRSSSRMSEAEKIELNHVDHEHLCQNGGGTVPLMGTPNGGNGVGAAAHNNIHAHSNNTGNLGGGGLGHGLNNVMMRKCGVGSGGSREHSKDYKALPTADPDDTDMDKDIGGGRGCEEDTPFLQPSNLNVKRHSSSTPLQSPGGQMGRSSEHFVPTPKVIQPQVYLGREVGNNYPGRDSFPDLLREKMPSLGGQCGDFTTSLPRPNRNHEPRPGSYFHRRINSESQSPLLSSNSYGVSMERVASSSLSGSESNFTRGNFPDSSVSSGGNGHPPRPPQQRLSMPTSPTHERDVLSYDYHAAQLATFLEEYRLLQLELMRMSASLTNHVDQPVHPNNVNASTSQTISSGPGSRQPSLPEKKPPFVPPRQLPLVAAGTSTNPFHPEASVRTQQLHQRHLLQRAAMAGQHHQLKSILKNPSASNNNYMA